MSLEATNFKTNFTSDRNRIVVSVLNDVIIGSFTDKDKDTINNYDDDEKVLEFYSGLYYCQTGTFIYIINNNNNIIKYYNNGNTAFNFFILRDNVKSEIKDFDTSKLLDGYITVDEYLEYMRYPCK